MKAKMGRRALIAIHLRPTSLQILTFIMCTDSEVLINGQGRSIKYHDVRHDRREKEVRWARGLNLYNNILKSAQFVNLSILMNK